MNKNQSTWARVDSYRNFSSWPTPLQPPTTQKWPVKPNTNNEAEQLLREAVGYWDASLYRDGDRFLRNQGTAGDLLDLRLGSSVIANTNDPLFLRTEDNGYAYLPGVASNYLSVPDENALDITGNIDLRALVSVDTWTPSATSSIINKGTAAQGNLAYQFQITTAGRLQLVWSTDGSAFTSATSSITPMSASASIPLWVRTTLNVNNGGIFTATFFESLDGTTWSQIGTVTNGASTTSIFSSTSELRVGANTQNGNLFSGKIYRAQVLNGINGTTVLDIDCNDIESASQTNFSAKTGQVVSVNRSSSGRKTVLMPSKRNGGQPCFLFGADDYMECLGNYQHQLLNFDTGDSGTVLAVVRLWADPQSTATVYKHASGNVGWSFGMGVNRDYETTWIYWQPTGLFVNGAPSYNGVYIAGQLETCAAIFDDNRKRINSYRGTTKNLNSGNIKIRSAKQEISAGLFNSRPMRVGANSATSPGNYAHMEFTATAIWRRPLTSSELALLNNYFQNRRTFTYTVPSDTEQKNFLAAKLGVSSSVAALDILKDAPFFIDSRNFKDGSSHVQNLGWRRDGLNIRLGSSIASDSNDPKYLSPESSGYVYFPGVIGNLIQVNSTTLSSISTLDFAVRVSLDSLGVGQSFCGWDSTHAYLAFTTTNNLTIRLLNTSVQSIGGAISTVSVPNIAINTPVWLRGRLTISTAQCEFWYSYDNTNIEANVTWIPLGTPVIGANAGTTPLFTQSMIPIWGSFSSGIAGMAGKFYAGVERIDGSVRQEIRTSVITSASASTIALQTGQTGTIARSTTGRKSVAMPSTANGGRPIWLFGTDDYMEMEGDIQHSLLNIDGNDSFSALAVYRIFDPTASSHQSGIITKGTSGSRWQLSDVIGPPQIIGLLQDLNGTSTTATPNISNRSTGQINIAGVIRNRSLSQLSVFNFTRTTSTVTDNTNANIRNTQNLAIGNASGNTSINSLNAEFLAGAIFRRALSAAEISTLTTFFTS